MTPDNLLTKLGISDDAIHTTPVTTKGGTVTLSNPPDPKSAVKPVMKQTNSLDEFKSWLQGSQTPVSAPDVAAIQASLPAASADPASLTQQDVGGLMNAAHAYVSGDMDLGTAHKQMIEQAYAPFNLAVYALENVTVCGNSPLVISGPGPVVLNFGNVDVYSGGQIQILTTATINIQQLTKHDIACV